MNDFEKLSDSEVSELARHWRREALRGDMDARGRAHEYEVEHRRRVGSSGREQAVLRIVTPLGEVPMASTWRRRWSRLLGGREFA
jgi:hypothetical protein